MSGGPNGHRRAGARFAFNPGAIGVLLALVMALAGLNMDSGTRDAGGSDKDSPTPSPAALIGGLEFVDRTDAAGLDAAHVDPSLPADFGTSSGVAVGDVNDDGAWDLYVPRLGKPGALFVNRGDGSFADHTEEAGLAISQMEDGSHAAVFLDADADGDADLLVLGAGAEATVFLHNDGQGHFEDRTSESGLALPRGGVQSGRLHSATIGDYDNDGYLDVLLLEWHWWFGDRLVLQQSAGDLDADTSLCELAERASDRPLSPPPQLRSRLMRNDGTGRFEDVTAAVGLDLGHIAGMSSQFLDLDGDGYQDLLVAGDFCTSRVFRNVGGQMFQDVTEESGAGSDENGMGSAIVDIDGDGTPDWFVTSIASEQAEAASCARPLPNVGCSGNRLYVNQGEFQFADRSRELGVRSAGWGWGVAIEDFAAVGQPQIVVTNGLPEQTGLAQGGQSGASASLGEYAEDPNRFWVRAQNGSFVDAATDVSIDGQSVGHGLVPLDVDSDGRLDVVVANTPEGPRLYRNERPTDRSWLVVRLEDPDNPGNFRGEGARVRVVLREGGSRTGWILSSGSYESQKPPEFHVGLGDAGGGVSRIEVWWPGQPWNSDPQVVNDVSPNQVLTVTRHG